jgi:glutamate carboxypeptidase
LREIVDIDSSSRDKAGVDAVGARFARLFAAEGIAVQTLPLKEAGDVLRARIGSRGGPPGRCCWATATPFSRRARHIAARSASTAARLGPGVCDMKGGLVLNAFALVALKRHFGDRLPVEVVMTGDEEIGSPHSRDWIWLSRARPRRSSTPSPRDRTATW